MSPIEQDLWLFAAFCFGTIAGSFLNVCILRLPAGQSIVSPPSRCPRCKKPIRWYDNIPILSYLLLSGRCRYCRKGISWQYPLVEAITGLYSLAATWRFWDDPKLAWVLVLGALAILLSAIDLKTLTLPDNILLPFGALGLLLSPWNPWMSGEGPTRALEAAWGFLLAGGLLWGLSWVGERVLGKEIIGGGDIKLLAVLGAVIGWSHAVNGLFLGTALNALVLLILWLRGKFRPEAPFAFGPYLFLGALAGVFVQRADFFYWFNLG
jgi:leader peptidase (prepilin peptidase)/N-methyltransferase